MTTRVTTHDLDETLTLSRPMDKCDRHRTADAYVAVRLDAGVLKFCAHCWVLHRDVLTPLARQIHDESQEVTR